MRSSFAKLSWILPVPVVVALLLVAGCTAEAPPEVTPTTRTTAATPARTSGPAATALPQAKVAGVVARGLVVPWGIDFLPGGDALVAERDTARIQRVDSDGTVTPAGGVPGVETGGEGGLLGLALSPLFEVDRRVYVYYSTSQDNRIAAMTYENGQLSDPSPVVTGIPSSSLHNGGRIVLGPDGMLYASTGDATDGDNAQDLDSLGGKILRMTPDGEPAPGNPFEASLVYSYGHRNVQGLAFDSHDRLWASEFGATTWDELNLIQAGGNYGWPEVEGRADDERYLNPKAQWRTDEASPSGIAIVDDVVYLANLRGQRVWQVPIRGSGVGEPRELFTGDYGRLRTVLPAGDGSLWLATSNRDGRGQPRVGDDKILRITLG